MSLENKSSIDKKTIRRITCYAVVFLILIILSYHTQLSAWLVGILELFSPILLGLAFAYVINPVFRFFERKIFFRLRPSALRRALSLLCSYLFFLLVAVLLLLLILPQLIAGIATFVANYQSHVGAAVESINGLFDTINSFFSKLVGKDDFFKHIDSTHFFDWIYRLLDEFLNRLDMDTVTDTASSVVGVVTDVIFATFISIYLLASKEKRYAQIMKLRNAVFSENTNASITTVCTAVDRFFGKFIEGRLIDSCIILLILYVLFQIVGIPYAILVSAFMAIAALIPVIGFVIGAIPSGLIVLLTDADKILPFIIIVFVIAQIDSNIISPKILGNNTGISSLCVIIAICVTGTAFGPVGMLIAVPLFATMLELLETLIHRRLKKKRLPDDVENYYAPDPIIDPMQNVSTGNAKLARRLEKRILRIEKQIAGGTESDLKFEDRMVLKLYHVAKKFRLLLEIPPDLLTQFSAENAETAIRLRAEQDYGSRIVATSPNADNTTTESEDAIK